MIPNDGVRVSHCILLSCKIAKEIMKVLTFWDGVSVPGGEHVEQEI